MNKRLVEQAEVLIESDSGQEFTTFLKKEIAAICTPLLGQLLRLVCFYHACDCAIALLELEALKGKVHIPLEGLGYSPLDLAALSLSDKLAATFVHYGRNEIFGTNEDKDHVMAALSLAVDAFAQHDYFNDWIPEKSLYKLLCIFCIPELKEGLDTVKFLTLKTNKVEKLGYQCLEEGKIVQFFALLLVAGNQFDNECINDRNPIQRYIWDTKKVHHIGEPLQIQDRQLRYLQGRMGQLFSELMATREVVEKFRNSDECICAKRHELPYMLGEELIRELDVDLTPSQMRPKDIKCLSFQLSPEDKDCLEGALEKKLESHPQSTTIEPIPYTTWRHYETDPDIVHGSLLDEILRALSKDDKDIFVELMNKVNPTDDFQVIRYKDLGKIAIEWDSVKCATAMLEGKLAEKFDFSWSSKDGRPPLHLTAKDITPGMTALFLERGENPNVRRDCAGSNLKDALPLNIALDSVRKMAYIREWPKTNSFIDLLAELCQASLRASLENIRLLVQATHGVKDEFLKYMNSGSLVELCCLLIVAQKEFDSFIRPPNNTMSYRMLEKSQNYQLDKKISFLFHIFNKVGDKIGAYVQLEDRKSVHTIKLELTWLMKKAGLFVNGDVACFNDSLRREVKSPLEIKYFDFYSQRQCVGRSLLRRSKQAPSIMLSTDNVSQRLHTSTMKTHPNHYTSILALIRKGLRRILRVHASRRNK